MIPAFQTVKHDPPHSYGDCLRACVASLLNVDTARVPHFFDNGATPEQAAGAMDSYLQGVWHLAPFNIGFQGDDLGMVLETMADVNPGIHYMLFGRNDAGPHVCIYKDDKLIHDPGLAGQVGISHPCSSGIYIVMVFVPSVLL